MCTAGAHVALAIALSTSHCASVPPAIHATLRIYKHAPHPSEHHYLPSRFPAASLQDLTAVSASGSYITSVTGERILDFACGIGATSTGHSHPALAAAIARQAETFLFAQQNCVPYHQTLCDSVEALRSIMPENLDRFFFTNSGSEAVDNAVKIARHATRRPNIITFEGAFHGRTVAAMSLTMSKVIISQNMHPKMPGVIVAPFPNCLHCQVRES